MRRTDFARAAALLALVCLAAGCSRKEPNLINPQRGLVTPDEFAILPGKPLEIPETLNELPPPTPGGANRTDINPEADVVVALGGNPAAVVPDGRLGADGALIQQASRYGVDPNVRTALASEDLEFRRRHRGRLLERWFGVTTYYKVYSRGQLDQPATTELFRRSGVPTPAMPPDTSGN